MKPVTPNEWKLRLEQAQRYKEYWGNSRAWQRYRNYQRGKFENFAGDSNGILPYNVSYAQLSTLRPNVYFRNPFVNITPRLSKEDQINAKAIEGIINWLVHELEVKETFKSAIDDCYSCGRGIIKLGFNSKFGYTYGDDAKTRMNKQFQNLEYDSTVQGGMPWAGRVDPYNFFVPYGSRLLNNMPWVSHGILRPTEDLNEDIRTKGKNIPSTHLSSMLSTRGKDLGGYEFFGSSRDAVALTEVHEIRDVKTKQVMSMVFGATDAQDSMMIRDPEDDSLQIDGLPFVDFTWNNDPEFYWSTSDAALLEPQQLEVNDTRTQQLNLRRLLVARIIAEEGSFDDDEIAKMTSADVSAVIKAKGSVDQMKIITGSMPPDLTLWVREIQHDITELSGIGKTQSGSFAGGRTTATEVNAVQAGANIRLAERRDVVGDALGKVCRKLLQIVFSFWKAERVMQLVGVDGAVYWVKVTPEQIKSEYDLRVDVESLTPVSKELKKRDILQVLQVLGNNPRVNIDYLMMLLLKEYEWVDALKVLPQAQESQQRPMGYKDFQSQQQGLMNNPSQLAARSGANSAVIQGRILGA